MPRTYKAKEYLLEQGKIDAITRGRMSNANKEFLAEAAASGIQFSDFKATETTNASGEKVIKNTSPRLGTSQIDNINEEFVRYPGPSGGIAQANTVWKILGPNGKEVNKPDKGGHGGLKTICNNCRLSLVGHMCNTPVITLANMEVVAVTIERR